MPRAIPPLICAYFFFVMAFAGWWTGGFHYAH
jgi:hypothetical protein